MAGKPAASDSSCWWLSIWIGVVSWAGALPANIKTAKIRPPVVARVVNQHRNASIDKNRSPRFARKPVCPSGRRANGKDHTFVRDPRDGSRPPILTRPDNKARSDRHFVESDVPDRRIVHGLVNKERVSRLFLADRVEPEADDYHRERDRYPNDDPDKPRD